MEGEKLPELYPSPTLATEGCIGLADCEKLKNFLELKRSNRKTVSKEITKLRKRIIYNITI